MGTKLPASPLSFPKVLSFLQLDLRNVSVTSFIFVAFHSNFYRSYIFKYHNATLSTYKNKANKIYEQQERHLTMGNSKSTCLSQIGIRRMPALVINLWNLDIFLNF